jgi:hypothetical protein
MEPTDQPNRGVLGTLILILVGLVAAALFVPTSELDTTRPKETTKVDMEFSATESIPTRLWADPFSTVKNYREMRDSPGKPPDKARSQKNCFDTTKNESERPKEPTTRPHLEESTACGDRLESDTLVVGVMVPAEPFAGLEEYRRRIRIAVIHGLLECNYAPDNSEHIGFHLLNNGAGQGKAKRVLVPFEHFTREQGNDTPAKGASAPARGHCLNDSMTGAAPESPRTPHQRILVLWLDESALSDYTPAFDCPCHHPYGRVGNSNPLASLRAIDELLRTLGHDKPTSRTIVLGPSSSGTLKEWSKAIALNSLGNPLTQQCATSHWAVPLAHFLSRTIIISPSATLKLTSGNESNGAAPSPASPSSADAQSPGLKWFERTIADDRATLTTLVSELKKRLTGETPHVLLVTAQDSLYSRALLTQFEEASKADNWPVNSISYLSAIDGLLPTDSPSTAAPPKATATETLYSRLFGATKSRWWEGPASQDYLVRAVDAELVNSKRSPDVVGVLAENVHDKIMVLKLLRDRVPSAVFFTTDADIALLNPSVLRWTTGTLVASSFGLSAHPRYQGETPPFRDQYQTAHFLAIQRGLALADSNVLGSARAFGLQPRVLEVTRNGFLDLDSQPEVEGSTGQAQASCRAATESSQSSSNKSPPLAWPCRARTLAWLVGLNMVIVAVGLGIGIVLFLLFSPSFRLILFRVRLSRRCDDDTSREHLVQRHPDLVEVSRRYRTHLFLSIRPWLVMKRSRSVVSRLNHFDSPSYSPIAVEGAPLSISAFLNELKARLWPLFMILSVLIWIGLGLWLIFVFHSMIDSTDAVEFLSWTSGTSVWPTVMIRLVAILLALILLDRIVCGSRSHIWAIEQEFFPSSRMGKLVRLRARAGRCLEKLGSGRSWQLPLAASNPPTREAAVHYSWVPTPRFVTDRTRYGKFGTPFGLPPFSILRSTRLFATGIAENIVLRALEAVAGRRTLHLLYRWPWALRGSKRRYRRTEVIQAQTPNPQFRSREDVPFISSTQIVPTIHALSAWRHFRLKRFGTGLLLRVSFLFLLGVGVVGIGISLGGPPSLPMRGNLAGSRFLTMIVMYWSFALALALLALLADITLLQVKLISKLSDHPTVYPRASLMLVRQNFRLSDRLKPEEIEPWLDVAVIGRASALLGSYLISAFGVMTLLLVSRSPLFDTWEMNPGIVFGFASLSAGAVGFLVRLQWLASKAKAQGIGALEANLDRRGRAVGTQNEEYRQLSELLERVRGVREGAFAPALSHPLLQAVMLPVGGVGLIQLIEYLMFAR